MPFSPLLGNEIARQALTQMLAKQTLPNTLLFAGPDGVGKRTAALLFAKALLQEKSLARIESFSHPDIHFYEPTGKTHMHSADAMRALLAEAALPPYEARYKVFILDEAEKMLPSSSNALLKTLEEPFAHAIFILMTSDPDSLLPTIASRCRHVPFFALPQEAIERHLRSLPHWTEAKARKQAFLSHGSLGRALKEKKAPWKEDLLVLLSERLLFDYPQFVEVVSRLETQFNEVEDVEKVGELVEEIAMWYRDLHLLKEGGGVELLYHLDHLDALKKLLKEKIPALEKVLDALNQLLLALARQIHPRHALERFFRAIT